MDEQIRNSVTTIQRHIRGFLARKKLDEANTIYRSIFRELGDDSFINQMPITPCNTVIPFNLPMPNQTNYQTGLTNSTSSRFIQPYPPLICHNYHHSHPCRSQSETYCSWSETRCRHKTRGPCQQTHSNNAATSMTFLGERRPYNERESQTEPLFESKSSQFSDRDTDGNMKVPSLQNTVKLFPARSEFTSEKSLRNTDENIMTADQLIGKRSSYKATGSTQQNKTTRTNFPDSRQNLRRHSRPQTSPRKSVHSPYVHVIRPDVSQPTDGSPDFRHMTFTEKYQTNRLSPKNQTRTKQSSPKYKEQIADTQREGPSPVISPSETKSSKSGVGVGNSEHIDYHGHCASIHTYSLTPEQKLSTRLSAGLFYSQQNRYRTSLKSAKIAQSHNSGPQSNMSSTRPNCVLSKQNEIEQESHVKLLFHRSSTSLTSEPNSPFRIYGGGKPSHCPDSNQPQKTSTDSNSNQTLHSLPSTRFIPVTNEITLGATVYGSAKATSSPKVDARRSGFTAMKGSGGSGNSVARQSRSRRRPGDGYVSPYAYRPPQTSSEDLREQVKSDLFMTSKDSLPLSHHHASHIQPAHSAHYTTSQVDRPAITRSGPIERRHQPPRFDDPAPIMYVNSVVPPTDSHISVETLAIPVTAGAPPRSQTNNNTSNEIIASPTRVDSRSRGRTSSEGRQFKISDPSPVRIQVTVDADNMTPVTIQVSPSNSPTKSSNQTLLDSRTPPTPLQTPPTPSQDTPTLVQYPPTPSQNTPTSVQTPPTTHNEKQALLNSSHEEQLSKENQAELSHSEAPPTRTADLQSRTPRNFEDEEETTLSADSSLTRVSDLEGSKLKDRSLFENQPTASTPIQLKKTPKNSQLDDLEVISHSDSMDGTSIWTTSPARTKTSTDKKTLRKTQSDAQTADKSKVNTSTDKTASDLKLLRENAALELVWIEQAIASRKQYLQLKEKMKDKSK